MVAHFLGCNLGWFFAATVVLFDLIILNLSLNFCVVCMPITKQTFHIPYVYRLVMSYEKQKVCLEKHFVFCSVVIVVCGVFCVVIVL